MSVCLVIIENHRYEKNIDKLLKIYRDRFSTIRFLVPFYKGKNETVIPVYDSSYFFNGFIAQAGIQLARIECDHYVFIADDLVLNPEINENNIEQYFNLNKGEALLSRPCADLVKSTLPFRSYLNVFDSFRYEDCGVHYECELPSKEDALSKMTKYGLGDMNIQRSIFRNNAWRKENTVYFWRRLKNAIKIIAGRAKLPYPIVVGFSDFYIIPSCNFEEFYSLCGVFAAMNLQVEMATPTATILSCENVIFLENNNDIQHARENIYIQKYMSDYNKLIQDWPADRNYLNPIKLSKWKGI